MNEYWDIAIRPLVDALQPRVVVEIGALHGATTRLLAGALGKRTELHVVDPLPRFDPDELASACAGRFVFHRALSLDALPAIPAADLALVDGDHNWYTVHHELKLLAAAAAAAGRPLPVLVMHDVGWPYGRRDLYYDPATIPAEYRQPHAPGGLLPGESGLVPAGGLNARLENAVTEGGPRNGVRTALEDFSATHPEPLRTIFLPAHYGLAVVAEERVLAQRTAVAAVFDRLTSAAGLAEQLELAERLRVEAVIDAQTARADAPATRSPSPVQYLELLRGVLLDEHYVENEVRNMYLLACAHRGKQPDPEVVRDPATHLSRELDRARAARRNGAGRETSGFFPYTDVGRVALDSLNDLLEAVKDDGVEGDFVVVGAGRGGVAVYMRAFVAATRQKGRRVWLVDRFFPGDDAADLNSARAAMERFGLLDKRVRFFGGDVAKALSAGKIGPIAFLHVDARHVGIDGDLASIYEHVVDGGVVVVHHGDDEDLLAKAQRFHSKNARRERLDRSVPTMVSWRKSRPAKTRSLEKPREREPEKLSVVVVMHDMQRVGARTLRSLSRAYQTGIEDLDYEVIVVENGTPRDRKLGEGMVAGFGPEFRYLDLGRASTPSPVPALQAGLEVARGERLALMIDGAHMLTPGVLHFGVAALSTYPPAVVGTQQWYIGPGEQPELVEAGYDEEYEDRLFAEIEWPSDGYALFDIGHFIGNRDWFDGLSESNCLFVTHDVLEAAGGLDEAFDVAGGGFANLDLWERLTASPDVNVVTILGEGSFHQVHGGTTTNAVPEERDRRVAAFRAQYEQLRGRPFKIQPKPLHYVGAIRGAEGRTKPRRRYPIVPYRLGLEQANGHAVLPELPIPADLHHDFVRALWQSGARTRTRWLGRELPRSPADLHAYQQILGQVTPAQVVVVGGGEDGDALASYLASICTLCGSGAVIRSGGSSAGPGVVHVPGDPASDDVVNQVVAQFGEEGAGLVVLAARPDGSRLLAEFARYAQHVPVGGYVVVEDTVVGRGVPSDNPFPPHRALGRILRSAPEFVQDRELESLGPSFNVGGYLRRMA